MTRINLSDSIANPCWQLFLASPTFRRPPKPMNGTQSPRRKDDDGLLYSYLLQAAEKSSLFDEKKDTLLQAGPPAFLEVNCC